MSTGHPSARFRAPRTIEKGSSLAALLDEAAIGLIGDSMAAVHAAFDRRAFVRDASGVIGELGLMRRADAIAESLSRHLPEPGGSALRVVMDSLGPELVRTEDNGLAGFFYLPHSSFIARHGPEHFDLGLDACEAITRRFTAEFCLRPFMIHDQPRTLDRCSEWLSNPNPHVRRLVSEGTRPRLPWGIRLRDIQRDPEPVLPLLEALKDDPELYVRRSVANHLGDIGKDHLGVLLGVCGRWLEECAGLPGDLATARRWSIRHALRHPAKKGDEEALDLRRRAR